MLNMLSWNFNRGRTDLRLFEIGNIFEGSAERVHQYKHACCAATGLLDRQSVVQKPRPIDFFDLKGDVEQILETFTTNVSFAPTASEYYHPGRSAQVLASGKLLGELGQLHPDIAADRKFKQEIWLAWLDLDGLFGLPLREPRYARLSRYPSVDRDFSLLLDKNTSYERLREAILALHLPELRSIEPHELFRGAGVPKGKYSLLLRLTFQSDERTLRDDEVAAWSEQVVEAVKQLGGNLRV
jgi:phenylalanyl-tRNA synthetase beta chain